MFRRLTVRPILANCALAASYFTVTPTQYQAAASSGSDANNTEDGNNNNNNNSSAGKWRRPSLAQQRARRAQLPPAFDIVHWNDDDMSRGHLLRVLHRDSFVVLDYHRQARKLTEEGNKAERVVSVMLPAVYTARFLGVLEGRSDKVEVQSRFTNAVFAPNPAAPHTFTLKCTSTKPANMQRESKDGNETSNTSGTSVNEAGEETFEWTVEFDAAESLMLHRFLSQALHYNTGFARTII